MADAVTRDEICRDLCALGIEPGDAVLVHSSLRSMGYVEGGADVVVEALKEAVAPDGTVVFPTLTGSRELCPKHPPTFDVDRSRCWTGIIPETARRRKDAVRSLHPTHSVTAIGPLAESLCYAHEVSQTPCGPETPYLRLARCGGKVLFIGCDLSCNTTCHGVEEAAAVPYHMQRGWTDAVIRKGEVVRTVRIRLHYYGPRRNFNALNEKLRGAGVLKTGQIGNAQAMLVETGPMVQMATEALMRDAEFFLDDGEKGKGWGDGTRKPEV